MKYFEVNNPYYALMKAENVEQAKEKYIKYVANDEDGTLDDEIKEVGKDYALVKFSKTPDENMKLLPIKQVLTEFHCVNTEVLIIDGDLI